MATLTVQIIDVDGLVNPTETAVNSSDDFPNTGKEFLYVDNQNGSACVVTITDTGSVEPSGATAWDPDVTVSIPTTEKALIGPFPTKRFSDSVAIGYSVTASVTAAVYRLPT